MNDAIGTSPFPVLCECATGKRHCLSNRDQFVVGRNQDADLVVFDVACSRQQFRLFRQEQRLILEPLSQRSPTYCNGKTIAGPTPLQHGMMIQAGSSQFLYLESDQPMPAAVSAEAQATYVSAVLRREPVIAR